MIRTCSRQFMNRDRSYFAIKCDGIEFCYSTFFLLRRRSEASGGEDPLVVTRSKSSVCTIRMPASKGAGAQGVHCNPRFTGRLGRTLLQHLNTFFPMLKEGHRDEFSCHIYLKGRGVFPEAANTEVSLLYSMFTLIFFPMVRFRMNSFASKAQGSSFRSLLPIFGARIEAM